MVKRVKSSVPETKKGGRFEVPSPSIYTIKRTTIIKNFSEIAKALRRDEKHFAKFLFKELAVPGTINGSEIVFSAKVPSSIIVQRVNEYVKEYVMCKECGKPDTNLHIDAGIATIKCEACGAKRTFKI